MDKRQRAEAEIAEFSERFPDADLDLVPGSVWEQVKKGVSLSRAYGGYEEKRRKAGVAARKRNEENAALSSGRIGGVTKKAVYTARDVAAMSAAEVRGNYDDILASMDSEGFYI